MNRRSLLKAVGAPALVPLLEASGQTATYPKRLVVIASEQGMVAEHFWPRGPGEDLAPMTFPTITSPLAPYRKDLLFIGGIDLTSFGEQADALGTGGGHEAWMAMLTGIGYDSLADFDIRPGGISVDEHIARTIAQSTPLPLRALHLAATTSASPQLYERTISSAGPSLPVDTERDPRRAFDRLFTSAGVGREELLKLRAARRSVLDRVATDLGRWTRRLGTADRRKLEQHWESVRSLERELTAEPKDCRGPTLPALPRSTEEAWTSNEALPAIIRAHMDIVVAALACDLTRIATLQLGIQGSGLGPVVASWPGLDAAVFPNRERYRDHHIDLTHNHWDSRAKQLVEQWTMRQVAYLIDKLARTPEPGSTTGDRMLDHTALLYVNNMSHGGGHAVNGVPWFIAGSCGGWFRTGRFVKLGAWAGKSETDGAYWDVDGVPHNGVLASLCQAMGVSADTFGDPKYGGAISALR